MFRPVNLDHSVSLTDEDLAMKRAKLAASFSGIPRYLEYRRERVYILYDCIYTNSELFGKNDSIHFRHIVRKDTKSLNDPP